MDERLGAAARTLACCGFSLFLPGEVHHAEDERYVLYRTVYGHRDVVGLARCRRPLVGGGVGEVDGGLRGDPLKLRPRVSDARRPIRAHGR